MVPMIAAKNMAGKETVDSSMFPACSLRRPFTMQYFVQTAGFVGNVGMTWRPLFVSLTTHFGVRTVSFAPSRIGVFTPFGRRLNPSGAAEGMRRPYR